MLGLGLEWVFVGQILKRAGGYKLSWLLGLPPGAGCRTSPNGVRRRHKSLGCQNCILFFPGTGKKTKSSSSPRPLLPSGPSLRIWADDLRPIQDRLSSERVHVCSANSLLSLFSWTAVPARPRWVADLPRGSTGTQASVFRGLPFFPGAWSSSPGPRSPVCALVPATGACVCANVLQ